MNVKWLGHSCMKLSEGGWSAVCDPFAPGMVPGLSPIDETADAVYCSHEHGDHNFREAVRITDSGAPAMKVSEIETWHDDKNGTLRGNNTIRMFTSPSGIRAVHLGDLGCDLTEEQANALMSPDVLMIPVGGFFTIGPEQAKALCSGQAKAFRYAMSHVTGKIEILGKTGDGMLFKYHQAKYRKDDGRIFTMKVADDQCWLGEIPE